MTAPLLLLYICAAILFQLAAGIGIALRRRSLRALTRPPEMTEARPAGSVGAWSGWREFRVARREFEDSTHSQCSFYLAPTDGIPLTPFKPGQFLTFALQVAGTARQVVRCYSLSDRPDAASYRITIKRVAAPVGRSDLPPGVASNYFHDNVKQGDVLMVKAPSGAFFINSDPGIPAVLIAGGIGITPMMSMLRWVLVAQPERAIHLFYGVRHGGEHAFKQVLEQLAATHPLFRLNVLYSRPSPNDIEGVDFQEAGHVDVALLRRSLPHGRHQFYVCGPPPMMASLIPALRNWGVLPADLRHEAFGPASVPAVETAPLAAPFEVKFRRSARTVDWDGRDASLLDFAERHGLVVESGCRSGSCGSCETKLISGTVKYAANPEYEVAPGHCLLCVATPTSALVLEA